MILIASWARDQEWAVDDPRSVRWEDGRPATLDDYRKNLVNTREVIVMESRVEMSFLPSIVAEVRYVPELKVWQVSSTDNPPESLSLTDPGASDADIHSALSLGTHHATWEEKDDDGAEPIIEAFTIYRASIKR